MLRLYSPAIVLLSWAAVTAAGIQGRAVVAIGLIATAAAVIAHCLEQIDQKGGGPRVRRHL